MKKNTKGSSLLLAMGLVMIISLLAFTILEYIMPFSRDIKGVENSSSAYYEANSGIEQALYHVYERASGDMTEYSKGFSQTVDSSYITFSSGSTLPTSGEGNSKYDSDWNTISQGNPIQLEVGNGMIDPDNLEIAFRVPDMDVDGISDETLSGSSMQIVNWQLSGTNDSLNASGSIIKASDVLESAIDFDDETILGDLEGENLDGNSQTFSNFYSANCDSFGSGCVLKFSVINKLELDSDNVALPFLEWKVDANGSIIPDRYTKIEASGKSYGYKKDLEIKIPGQTVNEAFDFTVFQ